MDAQQALREIARILGRTGLDPKDGARVSDLLVDAGLEEETQEDIELVANAGKGVTGLTRDDARLVCDFMNGEVTPDENGGLSSELETALSRLDAIANQKVS